VSSQELSGGDGQNKREGRSEKKRGVKPVTKPGSMEG